MTDSTPDLSPVGGDDAPTEIDRLAQLEHQAWDLIGDLQACLSAVRLIAAGASDLLIERRKQAGIGVYQDQASGAFMLPPPVHLGRSTEVER